MKMKLIAAAVVATLVGGYAIAQTQMQHGGVDHEAMHKSMMAQQAEVKGTPSKDGRIAVQFPEQMKEHTLANMRDHLNRIAQIQEALGKGEYDKAADIAEKHLGMSSLQMHGAHDVAKYMPKGMQDVGTLMHRSASQFAIAAQNASATGDVKPALLALSKTTEACVACHAGYKLK
jgi:cytochrome c556